MEKPLKVLVLVDCQNDFISGSLGSDAAQAVIPKIVKKIKAFDGLIVATMDTHFDNNYLESKEGKKLPVEHCIYGTEGWRLEDRIADAICDKVHMLVPKHTFGSVEDDSVNDMSLIEVIKHHGYDGYPIDIEMCGFCTDICVISNALILKAFFYDRADITVDASCCAGTAPDKHEAALKVMESCQIEVKR